MSTPDPRQVVHVRHVCGQQVHVLPNGALAFLDELGLPTEVKEQLVRELTDLRDDQGDAVVVAEASGSFVCPRCGGSGYAPQISAN